MGYTHYWYREKELPQESWDKFVHDVHSQVLPNSGLLLAEEYDKPDQPPIVNKREVRFNGRGGDGHETFYIQRVFRGHGLQRDDGTYFAFCKTAHKPYDRCVVETLVLAEKHFGDDIEIASDGDWSTIREEFENGTVESRGR